MSHWRIILNNLIHFRKQHLGVAAGSALCAMVLVGALTVGDSVRSTLTSLAEERIGRGDLAMLSPDGFFEEDLAMRIRKRLGNDELVVAPLALTRGTLTTPDGSIRVPKVQVLGVDERFWKLAPDPKQTPSVVGADSGFTSGWDSEEFFINERLHNRLKVKKGTRLLSLIHI